MATTDQNADGSANVNLDASDKLDVEIVDDTPSEDRGRQPLPKELVEELDKDDLEEYSDKVKKRLSQMKKVWHDERRAKETSLREKEEALRFAQQAHQENQQLKQRLSSGEKVYVEEMTKAATNDLTAAKERLAAANNSGDMDKITEAQEALMDAKIKIRDVERFRPALQTPTSSVQTNNQVQASGPPAQTVDPKAEAWRSKNGWFGTDEEMTALALVSHEKLVRSGVDPRSDDYYKKVDETMKKRFPEYFDSADTREDRDPAPRRNSTVVASASRSTAPRQVKITASEAAIAKRLGLTTEAYAREKIKLESNNV
jgi:hypothetical protein